MLHRARWGEISPLRKALGAVPLRIFLALGNILHFLPHFSCRLDFHVNFWAIFRHMVLSDGFLFPVKELRLLTNPCHWVSFLDVVGSYVYFIVNNVSQ
jgi:hypothetical protein